MSLLIFIAGLSTVSKELMSSALGGKDRIWVYVILPPAPDHRGRGHGDQRAHVDVWLIAGDGGRAGDCDWPAEFLIWLGRNGGWATSRPRLWCCSTLIKGRTQALGDVSRNADIGAHGGTRQKRSDCAGSPPFRWPSGHLRVYPVFASTDEDRRNTSSTASARECSDLENFVTAWAGETRRYFINSVVRLTCCCC